MIVDLEKIRDPRQRKFLEDLIEVCKRHDGTVAGVFALWQEPDVEGNRSVGLHNLRSIGKLGVEMERGPLEVVETEEGEIVSRY